MFIPACKRTEHKTRCLKCVNGRNDNMMGIVILCVRFFFRLFFVSFFVDRYSVLRKIYIHAQAKRKIAQDQPTPILCKTQCYKCESSVIIKLFVVVVDCCLLSSHCFKQPSVTSNPRTNNTLCQPISLALAGCCVRFCCI